MDKNSLKIHDWNAELVTNDSGKEQEVEVSFKIKGVNKPGTFVSVFQSGKAIVESLQGGESFTDYMVPLMNIVFTVVNALKKSK
ncbi:MAG: hypothetical protein ABRQ38_02020 [Candidatus Eremiobacterota bacterium]